MVQRTTSPSPRAPAGALFDYTVGGTAGGWMARRVAGPTPGADEADPPAYRLRSAQAAHLQAALGPSSLGISAVCLLFALLWWGRGINQEVMTWAALGLAAGLLCVAAHPLSGVRAGRAQDPRLVPGSRRLLWLATAATLLAGLMFGWGWLVISPRLLPDERVAFMLTSLTIQLWVLYSFSSFMPAFLGFWVGGILPGLLVACQPDKPLGEWLGSTVGLALAGLLPLWFAVRSTRSFKGNLVLQERVFRLLDEVTAKRDEAISATQAKSNFLASVSHDLRQPMHAINLYLASMAGSYERLRTDPQDSRSADAVQSGIKSLRESTLYLNCMFESLLDISRLNAGSVDVEIRHTTLNRMMAQLEADYRELAHADGLRFEVRLPRQFHLMEVQTDPALLERLLRNLLVNAFRYTAAGGVRLSVVARGKTLDFRVVDTGPGIPRAMQQRVFDEFFQVPGSQTLSSRRASSGRGIGLGLSISGLLADKLGTCIRLHSQPGLGSVFAVRQPIRIALRPQTDRLGPRVAKPGKRLPPGLFLAVIDDDIDIRRSTRQMLETLGAEVFTAESASQAVEQLGRLGRLPDLLLSDYGLVGETGLQAIDRLREEFNHDIPAILITGETSAERAASFRDSGLPVLYKPASGEQLVAAITEALQPGLTTASP